jgi:hypothetical protein
VPVGSNSTDVVSKVSSATEENDSVSADEIEDFIGKPETSDMVRSLTNLDFLIVCLFQS